LTNSFRIRLAVIAVLSATASQAQDRGSEIESKLYNAFILLQRDENERALVIAEEAITDLKDNLKITDKTLLCARDETERLALLQLSAYYEYNAEIVDDRWCFALAVKGWAMQGMGRIDEADKALAKSVEMSPLDMGYLKRYASWLHDRGEWQKSINLYRRAKSVAAFVPLQDRNKFQAKAFYYIGFGLIELGQLDEAEANFRELLELSLDDTMASAELKYIKQLRNTGAARESYPARFRPSR
jgi:tetratricopeptide (TPR) repeat protein